MKYPKHNTYEALYSKYLDPESLKILMDLAGEDLSGKSVIDICCGTGICTKEALNRNVDNVVMIDAEEDMIPFEFYHNDKTDVTNASAGASLRTMSEACEGEYDIAVCRQGANYWLNDRSAISLAGTLKEDGVFIFNTFNTQPAWLPKIKQYYHKNVSFTEISYITTNNRVHHVQIREGYPPHIAEFAWISPEEFDSILSPHFKIEKTTRNRTDYYRCVKK